MIGWCNGGALARDSHSVRTAACVHLGDKDLLQTERAWVGAIGDYHDRELCRDRVDQ